MAVTDDTSISMITESPGQKAVRTVAKESSDLVIRDAEWDVLSEINRHV
jgi:hypothetical protein